jgi:hypothetical protein
VAGFDEVLVESEEVFPPLDAPLLLPPDEPDSLFPAPSPDDPEPLDASGDPPASADACFLYASDRESVI